MPTFAEVLLLLATVGSGLVGGLCFAFSSFIMNSFDDLEPARAIEAMQSINTRILRSTAMGAWFGTAAIGIAAALVAEDRALALTAAGLYASGAIAITGRGNVPLNDELERVDPDAPGAAQAWQNYRSRWGRWNALRTVLITGATAAFAIAL